MANGAGNTFYAMAPDDVHLVETTCYDAKDGYADLPTLEEVLDEVHASMQEMMKSLKRKRHSRPLEARGAMWLLEKVNRVIHQGQEKIKEVEQHIDEALEVAEHGDREAAINALASALGQCNLGLRY